MQGRADVLLLLEEVWWLRGMEIQGISLWKGRFDLEDRSFLLEGLIMRIAEEKASFFMCNYGLWIF